MSNTTEMIPTIHMGLNQTPLFEIPEEVLNRKFDSEEEQKNYEETVLAYNKKEKERALELKKQIEEAIEKHGACYLSFSCTGRTRHEWQSHAWGKALPQYKCTVRYDDYYCLLEKR